ncbi:MAG: isochorismatase family protein [Roseomonas sp.]|nr:isochorismatase family protein [Roseomonas sp.]MCA3332055.1 isochorismatase family protein [Roseomonas sp.]MCA3334703.1 isochorismatase family protein [Roseomonas sp.]MCA3345985.1 isochorismatase family protein [Roseomonas sp.]MCA3355069.1 isochorismatase family protein [Roseomonas sp.]
MSLSREENYTGVFDGKVGFGRHPAVVVIDFTLAYTTPGSPFFAEGVVRAVADTVPLLQAARAAGIPVIHTKVMYHPSGADGGWFVRKVPALRKLIPGEPLVEIDPKVAPLDEEVVMVKQYPSPFFGTPLAPMLATLGVDTLILAGCSTSGCVRAGALDGVQHGYRVIVPRECVGDRHDGPHDANLFDINAKYGDVVGRDEVIHYLANLAKRND